MSPPETPAPVTILGAGLIGICTALSLLDRGMRVRLIDRGDPGQETSMGNAGVISPWSILPQSMPGTWMQIPRLMVGKHRPLSVRAKTWPRMIPWGLRFLSNGTSRRMRAISADMRYLCGPSIDLYRNHLAGTGAEDLVRDCYYIHAYRTDTGANPDALEYRMRSDAGAQIERVGAADLHDIEPALAPMFRSAILIKGQARALSPGRIGRVLSEKVRDGGGQIVRAEARELVRTATGWSVVCDGARYDSQTVVLALGAWSPALLRPFGLRVPLMAERGYHVEFSAPQVSLNHSVMDVSSKVVASTMDSGLRIAGQAEFADVDAPRDDARKARLTALGKRILPGLGTDACTFWMGRRPSFPDSLPAIGEVDGQPGLFCNFGHSHYGLMMAPKSGELAADLITQRRPNHDVSGFSIGRFG